MRFTSGQSGSNWYSAEDLDVVPCGLGDARFGEAANPWKGKKRMLLYDLHNLGQLERTKVFDCDPSPVFGTHGQFSRDTNQIYVDALWWWREYFRKLRDPDGEPFKLG